MIRNLVIKSSIFFKIQEGKLISGLGVLTVCAIRGSISPIFFIIIIIIIWKILAYANFSLGAEKWRVEILQREIDTADDGQTYSSTCRNRGMTADSCWALAGCCFDGRQTHRNIWQSGSGPHPKTIYWSRLFFIAHTTFDRVYIKDATEFFIFLSFFRLISISPRCTVIKIR